MKTETPFPREGDPIPNYEDYKTFEARVLISAAFTENGYRLAQISSMGAEPIWLPHEPANWLKRAADEIEKIGGFNNSRPVPAYDTVMRLQSELQAAKDWGPALEATRAKLKVAEALLTTIHAMTDEYDEDSIYGTLAALELMTRAYK